MSERNEEILIFLGFTLCASFVLFVMFLIGLAVLFFQNWLLAAIILLVYIGIGISLIYASPRLRFIALEGDAYDERSKMLSAALWGATLILLLLYFICAIFFDGARFLLRDFFSNIRKCAERYDQIYVRKKHETA